MVPISSGNGRLRKPFSFRISKPRSPVAGHQTIIPRRLKETTNNRSMSATTNGNFNVAVEKQSVATRDTAQVAQKTTAKKKKQPPQVDVDLDRVYAELKKIDEADPATAPMYDEEGEPLWEPVVVFESISRVDFREWLQDNEGDLRHWWYEPHDDKVGRVVVYSLPSMTHESTAGEILRMVYEQVVERGGSHILRTLKAAASPTCKLTDRDQEPDMSLRPKVGPTATFPNLVVEIEYENLSLDKLDEKLQRWMGEKTAVQVAIGIKIYKNSRNHVAILYERGVKNPTVVKFGESKALDPPKLTFSVDMLYQGGTVPPELSGLEISIDLVELRSSINAEIDMEAQMIDMDEEINAVARETRAKRSRKSAEPELANKRQRRFNLAKILAQLEQIQRAEPATADRTDPDGEPVWAPVVVFESISRAAFREWLHDHPGAVLRWWFEPEPNTKDMGRVVVHSLPSVVHEATVNAIVRSISMQVAQIARDFFIADSLDTNASPVYTLSDREQLAHTSLTPTETALGTSQHKFPNLVVDVEHRNVSLAQLQAKLLRWMGSETTVQVAIGVKIYEHSQNHVAMLYMRDQPPQIVRFSSGDVVADEAPQPYPPVLTFPVEALYRGATMPDSLVDHAQDVISIDLRGLHAAITRSIHRFQQVVARPSKCASPR